MDPWHSRGYLPHFDIPGLHQSITFRLADSLPADVLAKLRRTLHKDDVAQRRQIEVLLDRNIGSCVLRNPICAQVVEQALLAQDGIAYRLLAWTIMPNHVHVLIATTPGQSLTEVVRQWKGGTARTVNQLLGQSGRLWQREYWDRFIRDEGHFRWAVDYIEGNPVQAGLALSPEAWRWSSAWWRRMSNGDNDRAKAPAG
jgi:putative transposase